MKKEVDLFKTLDAQGCLIKDLVGQPFILAYHKRCGHVYTIEKINGTIVDTLDVSSLDFTQDDFKRFANTRFFTFLEFQDSRQATASELDSIKLIIANSDMITKK